MKTHTDYVCDNIIALWRVHEIWIIVLLMQYIWLAMAPPTTYPISRIRSHYSITK